MVFFERNGLRHGEFTLRHPEARVVELEYNSDSTLLTVWLHHAPDAGGHHAGAPGCCDSCYPDVRQSDSVDATPTRWLRYRPVFQCSCGP